VVGGFFTDEDLLKKENCIITFRKIVGGGSHGSKRIVEPLEKLNCQCISCFYLVFYLLLQQDIPY
jgi:hypothetical protein